MLLKIGAVEYSIAIGLLSSGLLADAQTWHSENTDVGKTRPNAVFRVGGGVTAPRLTYGPDPEYPQEARRALPGHLRTVAYR